MHYVHCRSAASCLPRRGYAVLGQHRSTQRKPPKPAADEAALTAEIVALAKRYGRSDQGSEFIATAVQDWLGRLGGKTLYLERASPWENGDNQSFNGKLRAELVNAEVFYTLAEAKVLIEAWRRHYHTGGPTAAWATAHPRRKSSPHRSRRLAWREERCCTNIQSGPFLRGRSAAFQPFHWHRESWIWA